MSFLGIPELLGFGQNGAGTVAQGVPGGIVLPANMNQATALYNQAQGGLDQQNGLYQALQGQNGIGNQSAVFSQQQALANALQAQSMGQGPNPAQAALAQTTGSNVANQAALMAGQRGAGSNVGLIARQAGQQGAGIQQQAVGQAATMQAQQQLAAQQQLQQQQAQMAGLATQQVGQQQQALMGLNQGIQNEQGQILNAIQAGNAANVGMQSNVNTNNMNMAQTNANNTAKATGSAINAGASALAMARGGMVPDPVQHMASIYHPQMMAEGGYAPIQNSQYNYLDPDPGHMVAAPASDPAKPKAKKPDAAPAADYSGADGMGGFNPYAAADGMGGGMPLSKGAMVPGKAKVKGDSYANDTVSAKLSPGEIVLPRHITQAKDAPEAAKKFVMALMEKQGKPEDHEDFKDALKKAISSRGKKAKK